MMQMQYPQSHKLETYSSNLAIFGYIQAVIETITLVAVAISFSDADLLESTAMLTGGEAIGLMAVITGLYYTGSGVTGYHTTYVIKMFIFSFLVVGHVVALGACFLWIVNFSDPRDFVIYISQFGIWAYWVVLWKVLSLIPFFWYAFRVWASNGYANTPISLPYYMVPQQAPAPVPKIEEPQVIPMNRTLNQVPQAVYIMQQ